MVDSLDEFRAGWRDRVRNRIRQRLPHGPHYDAEADRLFQELMALEVPSNADLAEMERRGELEGDESMEERMSTPAANALGPWTCPYLVRLKNGVGRVRAGSVGTVVEHWADGKAVLIEFYVSVDGEDHDHYVETAELNDFEVIKDE